jgi:hypothetical protein
VVVGLAFEAGRWRRQASVRGQTRGERSAPRVPAACGWMREIPAGLGVSRSQHPD